MRLRDAWDVAVWGVAGVTAYAVLLAWVALGYIAEDGGR